MAEKTTKDRLGLYIDLYELMQLQRESREENRKFGLKHKDLLDKPIRLLEMWRDEHIHLLPYPRVSQTVLKFVYRATLMLLVIAFFLGIFSGAALLRYNGSEPVNLLYFLSAVLFLPLITMFFSLLAMLRANKANAMLVHLSPAYWMENLLLLLPGKSREIIEKIQISPLLGNWIVIRRSQEMALAFSLGLFLALLGVVAGEDIAFSWSTTLHISPEAFASFLDSVAFPWKFWLPQAVPTPELIEQSHYFRLGGKLSSDMVNNAAMLGEWWKFLAMTTLVYAVILRFFFFLGASIGLNRAEVRSILSIEGVRELLREMKEPIITTHALEEEKSAERSSAPSVQVGGAKQRYDTVIGWAMTKEYIDMQNDESGIEGDTIFEAGGIHSLKEDREAAAQAGRNILLYVKGWEPPNNDFEDFLIMLSDKENSEVTVYPLGTKEQAFEVSDRDFAEWEKKISKLKKDNIRMIR